MATQQVEVNSTLWFSTTSAMSDARLSRPEQDILKNVYKGLIFYNQTTGQVGVYTGATADQGVEANIKYLSYAEDSSGESFQAINFIGLLDSATAQMFQSATAIPAHSLVIYNDTLYYSKSEHTGDWNADHFHQIQKGDLVKVSTNLTISGDNNGAVNSDLSVTEGALLIFTAVTIPWKVVDFGVNLSEYLQLGADTSDKASNAARIKVLFKDDNGKVYESANSLETIIKSYKGQESASDIPENEGKFAPAYHTHTYEAKTSKYITYTPDMLFKTDKVEADKFEPEVEGASDYITTPGTRNHIVFDGPIISLGIDIEANKVKEGTFLEELSTIGAPIVPLGSPLASGSVLKTACPVLNAVNWGDVFNNLNDDSTLYVLVANNKCIRAKNNGIVTIYGQDYYIKLARYNTILWFYLIPLVFVAGTLPGSTVSDFEEVLPITKKGIMFKVFSGDLQYVYTSTGTGTAEAKGTYYVETFVISSISPNLINLNGN